MSSSIVHPDSQCDGNIGKRGFTLTEVAIVLGIIGLFFGAIWSAMDSVYSNLRTAEISRGVVQTAQAVRTMYSTSMTTGETSPTDITTAGMFPVGWNSTKVSGVIGNPWNPSPTGNLSFVYANGQLFTVEVDNISDTACTTLVNQFNQSAAGGGSTTVGGLVIGLIGNAVSVSPATAGAAALGPSGFTSTFAGAAVCTGGGQNDSIAFEFNMANM